MEKNKRLSRLGEMLQNFKLLGRRKGKPCENCGGKVYYVFEDPRVKANGVYCSLCGKWIKFEHSPKYAKIRKAIKARQKSKEKKTNKQKYSTYLKSAKWKNIRQSVAKRDNYICQHCGKDVKNGFEIHHKNYKHIFHEEEDLSCLVCLCQECHENITKHQKIGQKKKL